MKTLLSTTEFVLWLQETQHGYSNYYDITGKYAKVMQRPLELGMFVPCWDNGNPRPKPLASDGLYVQLNGDFDKDMKKYQQAKERVLFEGFKIEKDGHSYIYLYQGQRVRITKEYSWHYETKKFEKWFGTHYDEFEIIENLAREIDLTPTPSLLKQIGITKG